MFFFHWDGSGSFPMWWDKGKFSKCFVLENHWWVCWYIIFWMEWNVNLWKNHHILLEKCTVIFLKDWSNILPSFTLNCIKEKNNNIDQRQNYVYVQIKVLNHVIFHLWFHLVGDVRQELGKKNQLIPLVILFIQDELWEKDFCAKIGFFFLNYIKLHQMWF